eukprot:CAMPEP_0180684890 /NCGR_PEP_ID=MMETSP1037_2-20121125/72037_1 /TAXON_ID=632150 /ORGANISM="Azadinium spinosum, Strain 3D9" /LENGTH=102 /DNA_ID=CAMNT_0022715391 /DNA_START=154 /DNA_END=462 /DNA_ORIENTATION=-
MHAESVATAVVPHVLPDLIAEVNQLLQPHAPELRSQQQGFGVLNLLQHVALWKVHDLAPLHLRTLHIRLQQRSHCVNAQHHPCTEGTPVVRILKAAHGHHPQ